MKKIILAAMTAAAMLAFSNVASARPHGKHSQYSANYEVEETNPLDAILGGTDDNWGVSPVFKFKSRKHAQSYYKQREATYRFDQADESYTGGSIVALGRELQHAGFRVSEHPAFGGVHHVHAHHSAHYSGNAIDINVGRGVYERPRGYAGRFDRLASNLRAEGYTVLWRTAGHYNHMHVQR